MAALGSKDTATMMLHRAGTIAVQALRADLRDAFEADVAAGLDAIGHLHEIGPDVDLGDPNAVIYACLATGVDIADLEEALSRAKFHADQERLAG